MTDALPTSALPAEAAVLLVLLAPPGTAPSSPTVSAAALAMQQLGTSVRVLRIDASSHPSVVSSFHATELPCCVLVHHGLELWRASGLPNAAIIVALLLSKLSPTGLATY